MYVRYAPEDGDKVEWDFDPGRVRASECSLLQSKWGGRPWDEFRAAVMKGDMTARRVLLWHLIRLEHHTLRFEDTPDFMAGELTVEGSRAELEEWRAAIAGNRGIPESDRDMMLAALDDEIAKAPASPGKAKRTTSSKSTGSP